MLRFATKSWRNVDFFDKDGARMLAAMGCSGKVPGGLGPDDLDAALEALQAAVAAAERRREETGEDQDQDDDTVVAPKSRALPLIELLDSAIRHEAYVTWERY